MVELMSASKPVTGVINGGRDRRQVSSAQNCSWLGGHEVDQPRWVAAGLNDDTPN
jgi:hypothetical protein